MRIEATVIPDVKIITPRRHGDRRGFFCETFRRETLTQAGLDADFVQDNHSRSEHRGVLRGLHYQIPPQAQNKLVRVVRGAILDVAVDIRQGSPTFGQHVAMILSEENFRQAYVPTGFAHGFVTLEPDTEVLYKVTAYYAPELERGISWNDPALGIDWGETARDPILSDRDQANPPLGEVADLFGTD